MKSCSGDSDCWNLEGDAIQPIMGPQASKKKHPSWHTICFPFSY